MHDKDRYRTVSVIIDHRPYDTIATMLRYVPRENTIRRRAALLPGGHMFELALDNNSALSTSFSAFQQHVSFHLLVWNLMRRLIRPYQDY